MTMNKPKVLVMGVTGQIGKVVLQNLRQDEQVQVVAAARSPEKLRDLDVPVVTLDLDKIETIAPALEGVDRVFMMTGYTIDMLRQSKDFLNIAKKTGVRYVVHLGACGDDDTRIAHYAWHQFIERYIEWSGFSFTHLRPEIFMQNLLGYGGAKTVENGVIRHYVGNTRWSWVDGDDVAAVAVKCLIAPEKHAGQTYRLGYDARTFDEIAQTFTSVIGQPFRYEARPPEEFLQNVLAAGAEPSYMNCVYNSYRSFTAGDNKGADEVFDNFQAIVGRKPKTIADFAKKYADEFKYEVLAGATV